MFYRTVTPSTTRKGTRYVETFYWCGVYDVTIGSVTIKNLSREEFEFFWRTF